MFETRTLDGSLSLQPFALTILLATSTSATADFIGGGLGQTSEYLGSETSVIIPVANFEITTPVGIFKNNELGVQWDISNSAVWDTGPVVRLNTGRDNSIDDEVVGALPEIEAGLEAGWFIGSGFQLASVGVNSDAIVIGNLNVTTNVGSGHGGTLLKGALGLVMPLTADSRIIPSVSFSVADDDYNTAFYGVSSEDSSDALSAYRAGAGLLSTQAALVAIHKLNSDWSLTGTAAYTQLQGDAANSPIVARGSDSQLFTGVTLNYLF